MPQSTKIILAIWVIVSIAILGLTYIGASPLYMNRTLDWILRGTMLFGSIYFFYERQRRLYP